LVSAEEGEAIVQAAWELRRSLHPKPDCSHFAHDAYAQAGFDYEYAQSRVIFDGVTSFQRVQKPQPGDLVVWQGHVGIVVDAVGHTFYSSVLAGFAIEDYRSNYWTHRGRPRFYRYLVNDPQTAQSLACSVAKEDFFERAWRHESITADTQRADKATVDALNTKDASGCAEIEIENAAGNAYGMVELRGATDVRRPGLSRQGACWIVF
jgi:hypothetical protein